MSIDDTMFLEDIQEVRAVAEMVLVEKALHVVMDDRKIDEQIQNVSSYACNQLLHLDSVYSCAAVNIGTHARSLYDACAIY